MKKYNFALIGCGRISYKHINAINKIENAKLVAVCDIKEERAKTKGEENSIPWYTDYHEMLKKVDIDIVNILVESGKHAEIFVSVNFSGVVRRKNIYI
jgi:predicted dehydrogenase